jgi:quercetin dioxygenase-like cupin family protein
VTIGSFFQEKPTPNRIVAVRKNERRHTLERERSGATRIGYRYESLAYPMSDKTMEPFMVEIDPGEEEDLVFYNHGGEEFLHVLEGRMEFRGGDQVLALAPGDSLYFDSSIPHALRGLGGKKARVLAVVYASK